MKVIFFQEFIVSKQRFFVFLLMLASSILPAAAAGDAAVQSSAVQSPNVSGRWEVSWQARLGTDQAVVELQQSGSKLTGTFRDPHHTCPVSGTIEGKNISFEVEFQAARPYTIAFKGTLDGEKISGTSQAQNVGGKGAYLGHGGEIVEPEHPWTATRPADPPTLKSQQAKPGTSGSSK
jgi:hypothetical protein